MDRLGQLDAASQDAVIELVRALEEQLSGLPASRTIDLLEAEIAGDGVTAEPVFLTGIASERQAARR